VVVITDRVVFGGSVLQEVIFAIDAVCGAATDPDVTVDHRKVISDSFLEEGRVAFDKGIFDSRLESYDFGSLRRLANGGVLVGGHTNIGPGSGRKGVCAGRVGGNFGLLGRRGRPSGLSGIDAGGGVDRAVDGAMGEVNPVAIGELPKDALEPDAGDLPGSIAAGGLANDTEVAAVAYGEIAVQLIAEASGIEIVHIISLAGDALIVCGAVVGELRTATGSPPVAMDHGHGGVFDA
jgi:hypothetical protein